MDRDIGFDLHGVLTERPDIMRGILEFLVQQGFVIHIISGSPLVELEAELTSLGYIKNLHYHKLYSIVDELKSRGTKMWTDDQGNWWCDDELWWPIKGEICEELGIKHLFDDSIQYGRFMPDGTTFHLVGNRPKV